MKQLVTGLFGILNIMPLAIFAQVQEPYKKLHGGSFSSGVMSASPDPLVTYQWTHPVADDPLQYFIAKPVSYHPLPSSAASVNGDEWTIRASGDILFDFGVEHAAWPEFESDDLSGDVEMSISEYNEPAIVNAGSEHPIKTLKPAQYGNSYRLELNSQLYEGVRFVWLHFKNVKKTFHIRNLRLICQVKPANYTGSFTCSDSMLNRIWYTGAYTVRLNFMKDYIGAILMERSDRHSWTGDAYPAQAAALVAFGNYDLIKQNLAYTSGLENDIAAYALYWVLSLADYFDYTGDTAFLHLYMANAEQKLDKANLNFDSLPNLIFIGWDERLGAGFERPNIGEGQLVYRCLCLQAWRRFADLAKEAGYSQTADKYNSIAEKRTKWILEHFAEKFGIHSIAKAVNAGLLSYPAISEAANKQFENRLQRLSYSPFNECFLIQAMSKAQLMDEAISTIKDFWGGQIAYGGTSFFEVYRPSWNRILHPNDAPPNNQCGYTSLAHPWGAGVTAWLTENILGIRPLSPGFLKFEIKPFLNPLITEVMGSVPTPNGLIQASFNMNSGECNVLVPAGTMAYVSLPQTFREINRVLVNGSIVKINTNNNGGKQNYISLPDLPAGEYHIKLFFVQSPAKPKVIDTIKYPMSNYIFDSLTSGNWVSHYGKDGYMFLGITKEAKKKLPAYIDSVKLNKNFVEVWDTATTDSRALATADGSSRQAAAVTTASPAATYHTMTLDIASHQKKKYKVSLYFLDWDDKNRRSAVEIFDLKTLELVSPVTLIKNYKNGKYLSIECDRPVRIRIDQVRGKNAAVSGLFFDPL